MQSIEVLYKKFTREKLSCSVDNFETDLKQQGFLFIPGDPERFIDYFILVKS